MAEPGPIDDSEFHAKLAQEKRKGANQEFLAERFSNAADLALKAVEQAVEAVAAKRGIHFHVEPRTAHARRVQWVAFELPAVHDHLRILWDAYGRLGYGGEDGDRAKEANRAMEAAFDEIRRETGI